MKTKLMYLAVRAALNSGAILCGLAANVNKEGFGKLPKEQQGFYKADGDNYVLDVEGAEDVNGLKTSLESERSSSRRMTKQIKDLQDKLNMWDGLDPEEIKGMIKATSDDEEGKLIKSGKFDEVIGKRMAKANEAHAKAVKEYEDKLNGSYEVINFLEKRAVEASVRAAATKSGVHPGAVEDALLRAGAIFSLDDEGNVVQLDDEDKPILGKDGKTPLGVDEWMESMKDASPHWFGVQNSGGGGHGSGKSGSKRTYKRGEFDGMTPQEKASVSAAVRKGEAVLID